MAAFILWGATAEATSISVAYVDSVTGYEWASLKDTTNLVWHDVAAHCATDGVTACASDLGAVELTGWTWATQAQVRDVMVNASDLTAAQLSTYSFEQAGSTWASQLTVFGPTYDLFGLTYTGGWTATTWGPFADWAVFADVYDWNSAGSLDQVSIDTAFPKDTSDPSLGLWLFRPAASVPDSGSTWMLLTFAVGGVGALRRRLR